MNNRSGMQAKALGLLWKKCETFIRAERKRIKRIRRMAPPKPLSKAKAEKLTMEIFGCNADEARKILSTN